MTLDDLDACLEGVIPSVVATVAADGTPNISYLSHVVRVDDGHVALSNQFFGKTAANLRDNPEAALLLVDGRTGGQVRLAATYLRSESAGALFDAVAGELAASSAQVGMEGIMRLKAVDVFRVGAVAAVPNPAPMPEPPPVPVLPRFAAAAAGCAAIAAAAEIGAAVEAGLDAIAAALPCDAATVYARDPGGGLVAIASRGYPRSGVGAEIALGDGLAGRAAAEGRVVRINDLSRVRRFGHAIRASGAVAGDDRRIPLPGLPGAQSQIAAPLIAQGALVGVAMAENRTRFAFGAAEVAAFGTIAPALAAALALAEAAPAEAEAAPPRRAPPPAGHGFAVLHHAFDDSVFIDGDYIIKGVAGRLLMFLLDRHAAEGRTDFSNREIRLAAELRLPDVNDNLETRLLLLRRRLDDRRAPVRLERVARGRLRLVLEGRPRLSRA